MASYRAAPSFRCHAPSRSFHDRAKALEYACRAARVMHLPYEVWMRQQGRLTLVKRFPALARPS